MIVGYKIRLDTIEKVKEFIKIVDKYENDIDIISGRYLVNAKSIMALFSLELTKPLNLIIHDASLSDVSRLEKDVEEFRVDEIWEYKSI